MPQICGTWVFISTVLLVITQEDCIMLMCHQLQILGVFLLISGWWHDQVCYVFPWSFAVIYVGCAADHTSLCIYGKYCVCVWKMALASSTYVQAWTVSVIQWWRFVLCYNIVLSVKLEVVHMIGGSNSGIFDDSGLLGYDTTSGSEWFPTLQRNIIPSFCF